MTSTSCSRHSAFTLSGDVGIELTEIERLRWMAGRGEYLAHLLRRAQEVRMNLHAARIEARDEIHEQPPASVQTAVVANETDEPVR